LAKIILNGFEASFIDERTKKNIIAQARRELKAATGVSI